ncbi:26S proteasome non-ATPase regulatory subunit 13 [Phytophthora boehmeriae]|uniref:26S proteasome non-ATPase regulatory subunit 13 n=1 Tax=Phytophthora boehmeriae TaxID=109152 RepID=A0A8T1WS48_9STRA|nr:26S proteasome non-ATPase regulatory subunit 13 [Phytophthora boehmeriae]
MGINARRYLSEADEKEAVRVLRDQLRHQKRVTSDDVRLAVRSVASKGGSIVIPSDFPPSRWVLEFKRVHGFVQFNSFMFGGVAVAGAGRTTLAVPGGLGDRLEVGRPDVLQTGTGGRSCSRPVITGSLSSGSDDDREKELSGFSRCSLEDVDRALCRSSYYSKVQTPTAMQLALQHNFSHRQRHFQQQHHHRMMVVDEHRGAVRNVLQPGEPMDDQRSSCTSIDSGNDTTTGDSSSSVDPTDMASKRDEIPNNTSSNEDKRGYRLSHTVPAETWEKAIAAVEHQGMSLRGAAKMYGVHFAALHRRVKKRAHESQLTGDGEYFCANDESGIIRVVVARAELGVLMTFEELMGLVQAAALRKLPDISVDSARKLLARFQSRTEHSIRHIIVDWPPPSALSRQQDLNDQKSPQSNHGRGSPPAFRRSVSVGITTMDAAMPREAAAVALGSLLVAPNGCEQWSVSRNV